MKAKIELLKPTVYDSNVRNGYFSHTDNRIIETRHLTLEFDDAYLRSINYIWFVYGNMSTVCCHVCGQQFPTIVVTDGIVTHRARRCECVVKKCCIIKNGYMNHSLPLNGDDLIVKKYICEGCNQILITLQVIRLVDSAYNRLLIANNFDIDAAINNVQYNRVNMRLQKKEMFDNDTQYKLRVLHHLLTRYQLRDLFKPIVELYWKYKRMRL